MKRAREQAQPEVLIALASAGTHRLVLRAGEIDAVAERGALSEAPLDVPRALGLTTAPGARAVRLSSGRWLDLGSQLAFRRVAAAAFTPLPVWLPPSCHALPLACAVDLDDGFGFEVDAALLESEL
jgi:hypothetical protein